MLHLFSFSIFENELYYIKKFRYENSIQSYIHSRVSSK